MSTVLGRTAVTVSVAAILTLGAAPLAMAAPVAPAPTTTATAGDGVWAPSHDEATALIPVCSGPLATLAWLNTNFGDHGNDVAKALRTNVAMVGAILTLSAKPYDILKLAFQDVLQVPVYAVNDVTFHQTTTVLDILSFCSSARG